MLVIHLPFHVEISIEGVRGLVKMLLKYQQVGIDMFVDPMHGGSPSGQHYQCDLTSVGNSQCSQASVSYGQQSFTKS